MVKENKAPKRTTLQRLQDELAAEKVKAAAKIQKRYDSEVAKLSAAEARFTKAQSDIDNSTAVIDAIHSEATDLGVELVVAAAPADES